MSKRKRRQRLQFTCIETGIESPGEGGGGGVLRILSDGDDRRNLVGFEIFDSGIFLCPRIWQVFFVCVWLDLSRDFYGYSKQSQVSWYC